MVVDMDKNKKGDYVELKEKGTEKKPQKTESVKKAETKDGSLPAPAKQPDAETKNAKAGNDGGRGKTEAARKAQKAEKESERPKKTDKIKDHVETDVDRLYELIRDKGLLKVKDAAKLLKIENDQVEEWGRILEEHGLVRLRYPPVGEPVLILKRFTTDTENIKKLKGRGKLKPARKVFIINLVILVSFLSVVALYTVRIPTIRLTYFQAYLAVAAIIIIGIAFVLMIVKRRKHASKNAEKSERG